MIKFRLASCKKVNKGFWLLLAAFILLSFPTGVRSEEQNAVTLLYFEGEGRDTEILIRWATATEVDTAGFMLERSQNVAGPYQFLSELGFIPSLAEDAFSGAEYQRLDKDNVDRDQSYYYILVELEVDGSEIRTDPILVNASQVEATATSTNIATTTQPVETPNPNGPSNTGTAEVSPTSLNGTPAVEVTTTAIAASYPGPRTNNPNQEFEGTKTFSQTSIGSAGDVDQATSLLAITPTFEGYPAPEQSGQPTTQGIGQSYPGPTAVLGFPPPASGYPGENQSFSTSGEVRQGQAPTSIGESGDLTNVAASEDAQENQSVLSTLVLWTGFFAAVAIFIAGVAGSIYLFSNRRIRDR